MSAKALYSRIGIPTSDLYTTELPFKATQLLALVISILLGALATIPFHDLFIERLFEELRDVVVLHEIRHCESGTIGGDLVVLDPLRGADQLDVPHQPGIVFLDGLRALFNSSINPSWPLQVLPFTGSSRSLNAFPRRASHRNLPLTDS